MERGFGGEEEQDGKNILHIIVSSGTEKPYYLKSKGMSPAGCFIRVGNGVKQMDIGMIEKIFAGRTRNSLRNITSPRYSDHSFKQLKIYYEEKGYELNNTFLQNLDLFTNEGKYNYVAYLLADVNSVSMKVAKYSGTNKINLLENIIFFLLLIWT
jgi:predicted HTH transcriptional regulator